MPESGRDPREHFIIQRRNLFLCSFISIFHSLFRNEENQLTLFSGIIGYGKNPPFKAALLIGLLYLFVRYAQAINQLSKKSPVLKDFFEYNSKRLQNEGYSFVSVDNDGNKTTHHAIGRYTIWENPPREKGIDVLKIDQTTGKLEQASLGESLRVLTYIRVSSIFTWMFLCITDITFFEYVFPFILFCIGIHALFGEGFVMNGLRAIEDILNGF